MTTALRLLRASCIAGCVAVAAFAVYDTTGPGPSPEPAAAATATTGSGLAAAVGLSGPAGATVEGTTATGTVTSPLDALGGLVPSLRFAPFGDTSALVGAALGAGVVLVLRR